MDKKKIKKLITETKSSILRDLTKIIGTDGEIYKDIAFDLKTLDIALAELSKSDWVSVNDELPPYDEIVDVRIDCGEGVEEPLYASTHRRKNKDDCKHLRFDKNGFIIDYDFESVTHWKHIEKLGE